MRDLLGKSRQGKVLMGWGEDEAARQALMRSFSPDSEDADVIGLCSDSLAEGVNLQRASVLLHLDMPSVVRIAEQRAGRVDRLDTQHAEIEVWWPRDAEEFQLTSDEKFVQRFETVESLLGANMPLPEHLKAHARTVPVEQMIAEYEAAAAEPWDGLEDAFTPVRSLVEGDDSIVPAQTYAAYRSVSARVLSRVSLVESTSPWAFFCLTAGSFDAPRWLLLPGYTARPLHDLEEVSAGLRDRLGPGVQDIQQFETGTRALERFIRQLAKTEKLLLSQKKQRALDEMDACLTGLVQRGGTGADQAALDSLLLLQRHLRHPEPDQQPDWDALATRWLDLIRPVWFQTLGQTRRKRPLMLKDLRKELLARGQWLSVEILRQFQSVPVLPPMDRRIRACIIGVPN